MKSNVAMPAQEIEQLVIKSRSNSALDKYSRTEWLSRMIKDSTISVRPIIKPIIFKNNLGTQKSTDYKEIRY